MKFVDEAVVHVEAGRGGNGALSFRREKFIPFGGPDGGDGGAGGDVVFVADGALNTLVDFIHQPRYRAESGKGGGGANRSGAHGAATLVKVPVGTVVLDEESHTTLGDLSTVGQRLVVAAGGRGGVGNARFKSSTNRAPRRTIPGAEGEHRRLRLQLRLLADVGLLGLPNAGKSSLLRAMSAAQPKVADYPFTTLHPQLGVVRVGTGRSFVMADIPGLIEGAAAGAGMGVRFLRHLARTRLLLNIVDGAPLDGSDPLAAAAIAAHELEAFNPALARLPRWLLLNKMDLLPANERERLIARARAEIGGEVFAVSALNRTGIEALAQALMVAIEHERAADADPDVAAVRAEIASALLRAIWPAGHAWQAADDSDGDDAFEGDDDGVEVIYRH